MNKSDFFKKITEYVFIGLLSVVLYSFFKKEKTPDTAEITPVQEAVQDAKIHKAPPPKPGLDLGELTIGTYQENPTEPAFNAPCPIDQALQAEVMVRSLPVGFNGERDCRAWSSVVDVIESNRSFSSIKQKIRDFVLMLMKLQSPQIFHLMGTSESVDLEHLTRTAICDEVALAHHRVKFGLDPALGSDFNEKQTLEVSKQDRILMEVLYRSCKMASSNAFRYTHGPLTRVEFYPEDAEWGMIKKALDLDEKRANESVCTFQPKK